ncbi:MAG: 5'-3' exonuclease H3TH domain-containing protein [Acidithiobacillus sp.]|jgi:DNA polymerase-1|uniref:5'-3' exonuclease n=1 Tax=Acidithiobacillus sp. TaxID=1872118 RepID=UPI00355F39ED
MIFLIDGNHLFHRALHIKTDLITSYGLPINAVYGCMQMMKNVVDNYQDRYSELIICWDGGGKNWRHKMFSGYKERRTGLPEQAFVQMKIVQNLYRVLGLRQVKMYGCEGDDIIGTVTNLSMKNGGDGVFIYSYDQDFYQLINDKLNIVQIKPGMRGEKDREVYEKDVCEEIGVSASQFIELVALTGQKKDDIPGIDGIGKVTASKLINQFKNIDNLITNLDQCSSKIKDKLIGKEQQLNLSKTLATINVNLFNEFNFKKTTYPSFKILQILFEKYEFKSFLRNFDQWAQTFGRM